MNLQIPQEELKKHLLNDEQLLWYGTPARGIKFRKQDIFLIPFSLMWGGFAIFWESMALFGMKGSRPPIFFALFGVPFVIMGLYLIFGRFLFDAKKRSNTVYGITNGRVLILSGFFSYDIKALNLKNLADITMTERLDGSGDINFSPANPLSTFVGGSWPGYNSQITPCFEMIENVSNVYRVISDVQKKL